MALSKKKAKGDIEVSNKDILEALKGLSTRMAVLSDRLSKVEAAADPAPGGADNGMPTMPEFNAEIEEGCEYFVRIKPHDPKRGCFRRIQYFDELGRKLTGGTGAPGDVPEWVPVTAEQARLLSRYRQKPRDPNSPRVLDIVTPAERKAIDNAEDLHRMAQLGVSGLAPQAVARMQADIRAKQSANPMTDQRPERDRPAMLPEAQQFMSRPTAAPPQGVERLSGAMAAPGRAAAMRGAAAPPPPPPQPQAEPGDGIANYNDGALTPELDAMRDDLAKAEAQARALAAQAVAEQTPKSGLSRRQR